MKSVSSTPWRLYQCPIISLLTSIMPSFKTAQLAPSPFSFGLMSLCKYESSSEVKWSCGSQITLSITSLDIALLSAEETSADTLLSSKRYGNTLIVPVCTTAYYFLAAGFIPYASFVISSASSSISSSCVFYFVSIALLFYFSLFSKSD